MTKRRAVYFRGNCANRDRARAGLRLRAESAATISPNMVIDTMREEEGEEPRRTTPKRFSLIDFEGPPVVNSTGMHRNATLLNSSAMERPRSLSASPRLYLPSYHPCPQFIPPLPPRSSLLFPFHFLFLRRLAGPFPTFVLAHADVVQYLHTDR